MSSRAGARCSREARNCCWTRRRWWSGIYRPCAASCRRRLPRRAGPLSGPWKADARRTAGIRHACARTRKKSRKPVPRLPRNACGIHARAHDDLIGIKMPSTGLRGSQDAFKQNWLGLNLYERFEQVVALVVTSLVAVIVVVAVVDLFKVVVLLAWRGVLDPLDQEIFQTIFGQVLTVLIALEFKHSIVKVVAAGEKIIQVKTVLLIAQLALARKFIVLDANEYSAAVILALAAVALSLGLTYWLIRDRDAKPAARSAA